MNMNRFILGIDALPGPIPPFVLENSPEAQQAIPIPV
jgi:hypothetical protein